MPRPVSSRHALILSLLALLTASAANAQQPKQPAPSVAQAEWCYVVVFPGGQPSIRVLTGPLALQEAMFLWTGGLAFRCGPAPVVAKEGQQ